MSDLGGDALIRQWRKRFTADPLASRVVSGLRGRSREIWQHTFQLLQQESPEYRNSVDDEFAEESRAHCGELLRTIVGIPEGYSEAPDADPFDFVRTHAEWRARRQVPLIASLHAYRLAHRTYAEISQEALGRHGRPDDIVRSLTLLSGFWMQLFDHVGAVLAEAHAVEEGLIVAQGSRFYAALVDDLLRGVPPNDPEAQRLCKLCGIRPGAPLAVAIARPHLTAGDKAIDLDVALRSFVRLVEQALAPGSFGRLVDIRSSEAIVIACCEGDAGQKLANALNRGCFTGRAMNGHSARVGVSLSAGDIGLLPQALDEARAAVAFTSPERPLVPFSDVDPLAFLIWRADPAALRLIPDWARRLAAPDDGPSQELVRTIRAYADGGLNVKQTAQKLGVHTNTVYFRLNRIRKISGLDPRTYAGLSTILTALSLLAAHPEAEPGAQS